MMRLVSAVYPGSYPFNSFGVFNSFITSNDPTDLVNGDCLVVWGGADIHPSFYNKKMSQRSMASHSPSGRDVVEWRMMQAAKAKGIPIIGVCRGAQMLCALAGGYLYQHVTGHGGEHFVTLKDNKPGYVTNSLHHQMMVIPEGVDHELLAWTQGISKVYHDADVAITPLQPMVEPEFVFFPEVKGFAVQWHPEMMHHNCRATAHIREVFLEKING